MKTLLAASLAALVASTTFALADSSFLLNDVQSRNMIADLGTVNSDGNGVVEIYDFQAGQIGALLGTEQIHAGANTDVTVTLRGTPMNQALALLKVNDEVVATQRLRYEDFGSE